MDKNFSDILGIFKRLDESRFHAGGYTPAGDVDEAANAAQQAAIAINMKKKHQAPKTEDTMSDAEHHKTGPEFTGYWKGTDSVTPGKKMVGGSCEESIEEQIAREWTSFLGEYGMTTGGTATGGNQPTNSVDQAKLSKEINNTTQNLNRLKSAGVTLPMGTNQAAKSTVTTANDPKANATGQNMDQNAKKTAMGLGQEMEKLLTTGSPTQVQQMASAIKNAKLGTK